MNLLEYIEGKRGENLATSALAYLLLRSPEARDAFFGLMSKCSPPDVGPLAVPSQFGFFLEKRTSASPNLGDGERESRSGRLDLFVETEVAVIGVESKFYAQFQMGQPQKYLETVVERATRLAEARGEADSPSDGSAFVVVLAPASAETAVRDHIAGNDRIAYVSWQDLITALENRHVTEMVGPVDRFLINEFCGYVRVLLGEGIDLAHYVPHLGHAFKRGERGKKSGSSSQWSFIDFLWRMLPKNLTDAYYYGAGATWAGWYFGDSRMWIGFMDSNSVMPVEGGAIKDKSLLVVAVEDPDGVLGKQYPADRLTRDAWGTWTLWNIPFKNDKDWTTPEAWQSAIDSISRRLPERQDATQS